jgi:hypothetical protein
MRLTKIVTAFFTITALSACGSPDDWFRVQVSRRGELEAKAVSACLTADEKTVDASGMALLLRREVLVNVDSQRTTRLNCAGDVRSDKPEVIRTTSLPVSLNQALAEGQRPVLVRLYNRTTCASEVVTDVQFTISTDVSEVDDGKLLVAKDKDNYIDFEFVACADPDNCEEFKTLGRGTVILGVKTVDKTLNDVRTIAAEGCNSEKN